MEWEIAWFVGGIILGAFGVLAVQFWDDMYG